MDETLRQAGASRADTWTYRYLSFSALPTPEGFVSSVSFTESDALIASPATFQVMVVEDYNRMLGRSETLAPGEALLECTRGNYEGDTLRLLDETFAIKARISDGLGCGAGAGQHLRLLLPGGGQHGHPAPSGQWNSRRPMGIAPLPSALP